ncbi:putative regulatory protein, FmdB family [Olavius algarvensis associated proteobacterium Delta 3]|nr:putative regulatory protein, FmdB family [Olavius algarvensis associated proteobacterium Delta 3]
MPVYEYEHTSEPCELGLIFEVEQSIKDKELTHCSECRESIHRIISRVNISTPKTNAELRDLGFTKLVRRDNGVYENVTRRDGDSRYMEKGKPETIPNVKKTIQD